MLPQAIHWRTGAAACLAAVCCSIACGDTTQRGSLLVVVQWYIAYGDVEQHCSLPATHVVLPQTIPQCTVARKDAALRLCSIATGNMLVHNWREGCDAMLYRQRQYSAWLAGRLLCRAVPYRHRRYTGVARLQHCSRSPLCPLLALLSFD